MLEIVAEVLFPVIIAFIMFTLGLGVTLRDFALAVQRPRALAVGIGSQMILLPLVTFALVSAAGIRGEWAFGIMILAACPGGVTTNMFTRIAGGNVALSISLTVIVTALATVTLPIWIGIWASVFLTMAVPDIEVTRLMASLVMITVVPAALGVAWRHYREASARSQEATLMRVSQVLFWMVLVVGAAAGWDTVKAGFFNLGPVLLLLALLLLGAGWAAGTAAGLMPTDKITIAIETGVQNSGTGLTALAILYSVDDDFVPAALVPLGLYVLVILAITTPLVFAYRVLKPVS